MILSIDIEAMKKIDDGADLLELAKLSKEVVRESQEGVYWVTDGTYTWSAIEGSEKLSLA